VINLNDIIRGLLHSFEDRERMGYDPYDALNSSIFQKLPSRFLKLASTQLFVYSPIDARKLVRVEKGINPKLLGLELMSLCTLMKKGPIKEKTFEIRSKKILDLLEKCRSKDHKGISWGFNFPWQDLTRYSEPYLPTIVNTSTIGHGLLDLYELTNDENVLNICYEIRDFILSEINIFRNEHGICFSYTPIDNNVVHNASLLGTSILARLDREEDHNKIKDVINFTLHYQRKDGSWPYSLNKSNGNERMQIDFHQGFNIDCLIRIYNNENFRSEKLLESITRGADFYFNEQFENGRSYWRWP
jgi:hypothetical protein